MTPRAVGEPGPPVAHDVDTVLEVGVTAVGHLVAQQVELVVVLEVEGDHVGREVAQHALLPAGQVVTLDPLAAQGESRRWTSGVGRAPGGDHHVGVGLGGASPPGRQPQGETAGAERGDG